MDCVLFLHFTRRVFAGKSPVHLRHDDLLSPLALTRPHAPTLTVLVGVSTVNRGRSVASVFRKNVRP